MRPPGDRASRTDAAVVLGAFLLLGVVAGVAWWLLVEPPVLTRSADGGTTMSEVQLGRRFDTDGWYAVIALVVGFAAGLVLTWWRGRDYRLTTALVVLGSLLAAAVAALVGGILGPGDPETALATAPQGSTAPVRLTVTAGVTYLTWPIAVLVGSLMVLWSSSRPDAQERADAGPPDPLNPEHAPG